MSRYYDRQGNPITRDEWANLLDGDEYRLVARDRLDGGTEVSTVWLGLDHRWGGGSPHIFETMVFNGPFDSGLVTGLGLCMAVVGVLDHNWSVIALGSAAALIAATTLPKREQARS